MYVLMLKITLVISKGKFVSDMVINTCNNNSWKAETGGLPAQG